MRAINQDGATVAPLARVTRTVLGAAALVGCASAPKATATPAPAVAAAPVVVDCATTALPADSLDLDRLVSAGFVARIPLREQKVTCRAGVKCTPEPTSVPNAPVLRADSYAASGCLVGVRRDGAVYTARVDTGATAMVTSALLDRDSFTGPWRSHDRVLTIAKAGAGYRVRTVARLGRTSVQSDGRGVADGLTLRVSPVTAANAGCLLLVRAYPGTDLLAAWDNGRCGGLAGAGWRGVYRRDVAAR
jgi:hypothetical protein